MLRATLIAGTALLLTLPIAAQQQDNSAPPPQQSQTDTKDQQKKPEKKSSDQANPFPEIAIGEGGTAESAGSERPCAPAFVAEGPGRAGEKVLDRG